MSILTGSYVGGVYLKSSSVKRYVGMAPDAVIYFNLRSDITETTTNYNADMTVHFIPEIGKCCLGTGEVNFEKSEITFKSDSGFVDFNGNFEISKSRISGVVMIQEFCEKIQIEFQPFENV